MKTIKFALIALCSVSFWSCSEAQQQETTTASEKTKQINEAFVNDKNTQTELHNDTIEIASYKTLLSLWDSNNYTLEHFKEMKSLPSIEVQNIAASLCELPVKDKKRAYFTALLLASTQVHDHILDRRYELQRILRNTNWSAHDSAFVQDIKDEVRYQGADTTELLKRFDVLPLSLIMAQGVLESAWGCSHFAKEGNSLFGEHFPKGAKGKYIQASGSEVRLRAFESIKEAVLGYIHNINRNHAYHGLRDARAQLRAQGKHLDGVVLANTEDHYSEIGHAYTQRIISVIHANHLSELDNLSMDLKQDHIVYKILK